MKDRPKLTRPVRRTVVTLLLLFATATPPAFAEDTIVVGSKKFPESRLLGEIMATLLEEETDLNVEREFGLASQLCFTAARSGKIDLYVEYTGTGLLVILDEPLGEEKSPEEVYERVKQQFLAKYDLVWLEPFGFYNTFAIAARKELGVSKLSDLKQIEDTVRAGFNHSFYGRQDGYPGLAAHYGFDLKHQGKVGHAYAYRAIESGEIDLLDAYSTDALLHKYDLVVLEDDKHFFPPYDAAPVLREEVAEAHPEVVEILNKLGGLIDNERMIELNYQYEVEKQSVKYVAQKFLASEGLIEEVTATADTGKMSIINLMPLVRQHLLLTGTATFAATFVGIALGIAILAKPRYLAGPILGVTGIMQTIPSLALLALMIPIFGLGAPAAIVALFLYSLLPIVRNTYTGITTIPDELVEAGRAMGMTRLQILWQLELPLATRTIMAGVRTALVINIGTATLAALIKAGGLGDPIVTGLDLDDHTRVLWGAVPAAILAIVIDFGMSILERIIEPAGLRIRSR